MNDSRNEMCRRTFLKGALVSSAFLMPALTENSRRPSNPYGELTRLSIREVSTLLRKKKVSPVELTRACLSQIDQFNPALNAFITITTDSALAEARTAEAEIQRGKWRGPLHGVPIALKDLFDTAGVRTTAASALYKDRIPAEDAEVVRRLKLAGAVFLGKQNMHEFAYGGTSAVSHFGPVHNPWALDRIPAGSSGGSAAAVAAELCYGALGSDTGGSIRGPAAYCGIVGLKPTFGLVSTRGVIPLSWSRDHVGPMTRTVADSAIMLQAIAGVDPSNVTGEEVKIGDYKGQTEKKTSSLRLGIARDFFFADLHPEVDAAIKSALSVIEKLTAEIRDLNIPVSTNRSVTDAEAYAYHAESLAKTPELYQPYTRGRLNAGAQVTTRAYIEGRRELAQFRQDIGKTFASVDALITPTSPIPARTILEASEEDPLRLPRPLDLRNCGPFNVNGLPSISVPCGFTRSGLPIGLQISGPHGGEGIVLQLAQAYEQTTDWHKRRPPMVST